MKLTQKDKDFLERLKQLLETKDLSVELKDDGYMRLVLRQNYGDKIENTFRMSRQGVRWRFQRIADCYVSAYETIYMIESQFGTQLRQQALAIARERVEMRKKQQKIGQTEVYRRKEGHDNPKNQGPIIVKCFALLKFPLSQKDLPIERPGQRLTLLFH